MARAKAGVLRQPASCYGVVLHTQHTRGTAACVHVSRFNRGTLATRACILPLPIKTPPKPLHSRHVPRSIKVEAVWSLDLYETKHIAVEPAGCIDIRTHTADMVDTEQRQHPDTDGL